MIDLTGQRFGRLEVKEFAGRARNGDSLWNCLCNCGNTKNIQGYSLKSGNTKSCGCLHSEIIRELSTTHGQAGRGSVSKEYETWCGMIKRCYNLKDKGYKHYGGRGIKVCDRWLHSFENFYEDMGDCPDGKSLDRKDNDGDYAPENCRWATKVEQMNNMRSNKWYEYKGEKKTIAQWERYIGTKRGTLGMRLLRDWNIEEVLTIPLGVRR